MNDFIFVSGLSTCKSVCPVKKNAKMLSNNQIQKLKKLIKNKIIYTGNSVESVKRTINRTNNLPVVLSRLCSENAFALTHHYPTNSQ